jgi:hypothetical protein
LSILGRIQLRRAAELLSEIDGRHWKAIRQILIEAKLKAETQLRNDEIIKSKPTDDLLPGMGSVCRLHPREFEGLRAGETDGSDQIRQTLDVQR